MTANNAKAKAKLALVEEFPETIQTEHKPKYIESELPTQGSKYGTDAYDEAIAGACRGYKKIWGINKP